MNARNDFHEPLFGVTEQFRVGDYRGVEAVVTRLSGLGMRGLRTTLRWSEVESGSGRTWHDWLVPALAGHLELLPCFLFSGEPNPNYEPDQQTALMHETLARFGAYFSDVELCADWGAAERDPRLDPDGARFADGLGEAIQQIRRAGKRVVLGGALAVHGGWLELLGARGLLLDLDAIGLRGFPLADDLGGYYWPSRVERVREVLDRHGSRAEIWITETGFRNHGADDRTQIRAFVETVDAPVQRFYWQSAQDGHAEREDEHCGLFDIAGNPRLLARQLAEGGTARLRELLALSHHGARRNGKGVALITGGAGFIGTNLAARLLDDDRTVRVFDNLHRPGTERNIRWLVEQYGDRVEFRFADVRDRRALHDAVADAAEVYHFAAQVAVTTSLADPIHDFEVNGGGTLNLLEALRHLDEPPPLLFTSTNKVYGGLEDLPLTAGETRYDLADPGLRGRGIDESRPLAFCSPYGCSKGASDQYVLDYARSYRLPAAVLRMSCIYGPHQFGTEDQGWVAHFMRQALDGRPIVIYGDGRQVRDILFVEDLIDAMVLARDRMGDLRGQAFNIGGGPGNTISLRELVAELGRMIGAPPEIRYEAWRASDQRYYVSDVSRFQAATGWRPRTSITEGLERLAAWFTAQRPAEAITEAERIAL